MTARMFPRLSPIVTSLVILSCMQFAVACKGDPDADGDGFVASEDCDDENPRIRPSATEQCNAIDDDCDGDIDEGVLLHYQLDADGDGYGTDEEVMACPDTPNTATNTFDCDDSDPDVHPKVLDICGNGVDDDCDGDNPARETWYADSDGDGFGDPATSVEDCDPPTGFIADSSDCDDGDAAVHPGVEERCDNTIDDDCDDVVASSADKDADGWYADACVGGFDCDDGEATIHPEAAETCDDGIDSDCGGGDPDAECVPFTVGNAVEGPDSWGFQGNYLFGLELAVPSDMTVTHLAVIGRDEEPYVKIGLYTDDGHYPDELVVGTDSTPMIVGALEIPVTETPITAGAYWIMFIYDRETWVASDNSSPTAYKYAGWSFEDEFPMSTDFLFSDGSWPIGACNFYLIGYRY